MKKIFNILIWLLANGFALFCFIMTCLHGFFVGLVEAADTDEPKHEIRSGYMQRTHKVQGDHYARNSEKRFK